LKRIFNIYDITMLSREDPKNLLTIDNRIATELQRALKILGLYNGALTGVFDEATEKALDNFVNINNFENKMHEKGKIWKSVLDYLEDLARDRGGASRND
jgi:uncharacterized Ntn-hydrolase superfamily protein